MGIDELRIELAAAREEANRLEWEDEDARPAWEEAIGEAERIEEEIARLEEEDLPRRREWYAQEYAQLRRELQTSE